MRPKISIIVPVYNAGAYLRPCLDSLVNQTLEDIEIICVVDCPTDGSDKVVEEYASKYTKVRVLKNDRNLHIGMSRNKALEFASGEYISFNDHDDIRSLDMCESLYDKLSTHGLCAIYSGISSDSISRVDRSCPFAPSKSLFLGLLSRRLFSHVTPHIYSADFIKSNNIKFIDTRSVSPEDTIFNIEYSYYMYMSGVSNFELVPDVYYSAVDTGANTSSLYTYWSYDKIFGGVKYLYALMNLYSDSCENNEIKEFLAEFGIRNFYTSFIAELRKNGLVRTLNLFSSLRKDPMIADIMSSYPYNFRNPNLRITKNIFAKIFLK